MALTQQDKEEMLQFLITRGKSLGSLDEADSNLSNKYLAPVLEYSGGTASKAVRLAVSLLKGDSAYQDWVKQPGNADKTLSDFFQSLKGGKGDTGPVAKLAIGTVASGETPDATITGEGPDYKLNLVLKEGEKGETGKTPVLASVEAQSGETPSGNFTANGVDESGNPKYTLNLTLPKGNTGDTGPAPILEFGEVTTVEPSDPASATFRPNGVDPSGANKYRLGLSIPKGKSGQDGTGAGNVLVNNEASLLASKQYAFKPGQDGAVNGAFVEVEASGKAAIPIPYEIINLNNESTSDEIKAALGGDEGFERIYEGAKNGVCFIDMSVASGGVATGGFICQFYQSGIESGTKMIVIGADLSSAGAGLFQCMIAKEGDVYSIDSNMQEGGVGYTGWIDKYFYDNSVIRLYSNRFSTGMTSEEINNALKYSDGIRHYIEAEKNEVQPSSPFDILYYYGGLYGVPTLYRINLEGDKYFTCFPKITNYTLDGGTNRHHKVELSAEYNGVLHILSIEEQSDGTLSCVKEERSLEVSKENIEKVFTGNILTHTHDTERIVTGMPTDVWDGVTVSTALAGSGTVDDPYLIQSCADYIHFYRNTKLYGHAYGENGPTEEMILNPKQIKFTTNLDFNNIAIDFSDTVPNMSAEAPNELLFLCYIDGQGCNIYNVNFVETWAVIPIAIYCAIKNIHILNGIFTISLSSVNDKGYASTNDVRYITPWGLYGLSCEVENISFVGEVKFTGDIATNICFIGGASVVSDFADFPGFVGENPNFYSNITFSVDEGMENVFAVQYTPSLVTYDQSNPLTVVGYDCTRAVKVEPTTLTPGLTVGMIIDAISDNEYTLYVNTDNALPFYNRSSLTPFHTAKTTAEMKSPDFLSLLNGDTETFVADTENVNDGYPVFKPNTIEQVVYDGYVKESSFEAFKKNLPAGGSGNVYNLDIDISGEISKLDANMQTLGWGRTYTAPTSDNIVELLGGNDGIRDLCEKLAPGNNPIVTAPFLAYILPTTLMSSVVLVSIFNSEGNAYTSLVDGCQVMIGFQFYLYMNNAIQSIECSINILNFNLSTQSATYSYSMEQINTSSGQSTEVLDYLTSTNTTAALSANQGRVLKGLIDNINSTTVVNSLTSTSTTNALSAAKGKELKTLVDGKVASTEITTIKKLTQSAYDALSSKDSKTLYIIA